MAIVRFPRTLTPHTGGVDQITIDAPRVHELLRALVARFPGLEADLETLAIAIDGEVRPDAAYERLLPTTEVDLVPGVAGG